MVSPLGRLSEGLPSDGIVIDKEPDGDTVVIESSGGAHSSMSWFEEKFGLRARTMGKAKRRCKSKFA